MSSTGLVPSGRFQPEFEPVVARLVDHVDAGLMSLGAQLSVTVQGECLVEIAVGDDGLGRPISPDSLFALYCTAKPLTTVAIAGLVETGALSVDARVGDFLGNRIRPRMSDLRLRDLLTHTAGLHHQTAQAAVFMPPILRDEAVLGSEPVAGWQIGLDAGYSEYGAWHLLGRIIEVVAGRSTREVVMCGVVDALGLSGDLFLGFRDDEYDDNLDRLGVNLDMHALRRTPLLMERSRRVCTDANPAIGGYGNARGVARFYAELLAILEGSRPTVPIGEKTLADFVIEHRPAAHDPVLDRECAFGLGFMVGLRNHIFGTRCSAAAFGHSGFGGLSCGFADPNLDLSVALLFNGHIDTDTSLVYRRQMVVDAIYRIVNSG